MAALGRLPKVDVARPKPSVQAKGPTFCSFKLSPRKFGHTNNLPPVSLRPACKSLAKVRPITALLGPGSRLGRESPNLIHLCEGNHARLDPRVESALSNGHAFHCISIRDLWWTSFRWDLSPPTTLQGHKASTTSSSPVPPPRAWAETARSSHPRGALETRSAWSSPGVTPNPGLARSKGGGWGF